MGFCVFECVSVSVKNKLLCKNYINFVTDIYVYFKKCVICNC